MFPSPPSSPLPGESGLLIRGADSRAQVYTAEGRKVNIASPSNLSPCHRSSPPVYAYVHARICTALRGKFPRGAGGGGGRKGFAASVRAKTFSPRYYLIRALTRAYESAELYYKPESYTRARARACAPPLPESIHTRLILLPHIILNAHGRLTLLSAH